MILRYSHLESIRDNLLEVTVQDTKMLVEKETKEEKDGFSYMLA